MSGPRTSPRRGRSCCPAPAAPRTCTAPSSSPTRMPRGSRPGSAPSWAAAMPPNSPAPSMPYRRRQPPGDRAATPADHLVHGRPPFHSLAEPSAAALGWLLGPPACQLGSGPAAAVFSGWAL